MPGMISNCTVNVVAGPSDAQVDVVQGLQELLMKQLDVLQLAHSNLTAPTHVTGIHLDCEGKVNVSGACISGADLGFNVSNSQYPLTC